MGKLLEQYYTPGMTVNPPPEEFMNADWFLPLLRRIEAFVGGYVTAFESMGINDWWRPFQEQKRLFDAGRSSAAVSEHCFAAALDVDIPGEFRGRYAIDFFAKVMKIDPRMRIGWLGYQKPLDPKHPERRFTFFHAGFGSWVPFDVREEYIAKYFAGKQAQEIKFKVNQSWKPEMRW